MQKVLPVDGLLSQQWVVVFTVGVLEYVPMSGRHYEPCDDMFQSSFHPEGGLGMIVNVLISCMPLRTQATLMAA